MAVLNYACNLYANSVSLDKNYCVFFNFITKSDSRNRFDITA